jgi:hypothetical protein
MKTTRTRGEMDKIIRESKNVQEFALNNEGQAFYTDYIQAGQREEKIARQRYTKAVAALKKTMPGGTWTFTIDGSEQ